MLARAKAGGYVPGVFTFTMHGGHPAAKPEGCELVTEEEKYRILEHWGVRRVLCPDFSQFQSMSPEAFVEEILCRRLRAAVSRLPDVHLTSSDPTNLELMPAGTDKGRALSLLCQQWGIPLAEVAALGDSENDREMLLAVGFPVAMGNAPPSIRAVGRMVADTNDNGGAAKAIDALLTM